MFKITNISLIVLFSFNSMAYLFNFNMFFNAAGNAMQGITNELKDQQMEKIAIDQEFNKHSYADRDRVQKMLKRSSIS